MTEHASQAAIIEHLRAITDDVYELLAPYEPEGSGPTIYYFDADSGAHVFVEWADERGWVISWELKPGIPTSAKLPTPDPGNPVKTAETIAAIRAGEIDEFSAAA